MHNGDAPQSVLSVPEDLARPIDPQASLCVEETRPVPSKPGTPEILWADVGERLGLNVAALRNLRTTFSSALRLDNSRTVRESIVPVLAHIESLRQQGIPDDEIRDRIGELPKGREWPEEVLARMEEAATATARVALPPLPPAAGSAMEPRQAGSMGLADASVDASIREMVFDLRRDITTSTVSERELLHHLMQCVQRLTLEVRDLRYAFLLASSRKDRKKGIRAISRLLSG